MTDVDSKWLQSVQTGGLITFINFGAMIDWIFEITSSYRLLVILWKRPTRDDYILVLFVWLPILPVTLYRIR